ncbi:hypothetical protein HDU97_009584 [Phlyctochytrium planicorne]|nr:hypothetical protein HDU97_009584 [Phlyctochytrium planicorne]
MGPIPDNWRKLTNLNEIYHTAKLGKSQSVKLNNNSISGELPSWLGNFVELKGLFLALNQFNGSMPESLSKLRNLEGLSLLGNNLSGELPPWLGNLTKLNGIYLGQLLRRR